ncbi:MAG TPA: hypothetical protein VHX14_01730 [Thermoanaerobaculia bacterium]|nr:hypothetical protein [Thermoanaerobaculia bacterium]
MTDPMTHIRQLFLQPKDTYSVPEAAEILDMPLHEVRGWMDVGELESIRKCAGLVLPWGELVSFGMDFWSQETVEAALGADLAGAIPTLLRLADLEVRIPRFEVLALERIAKRDGKSVDAILAHELLDFASANSDFLAKSIRGFRAALRWPQ